MTFDELAERGEVPSGAILAALTMLEATARGDEVAAARAGEVADLVKTWGASVLAQAFGLLIYGAMSVTHPTVSDNLHVTVPAVLTRLGKIESVRPFLPTMAGVLAAAATGDDLWRWRSGLGQMQEAELSAWYWTAWLLADLVDTVHEKPGRFVRDAAQVVINAADDGPPPEPNPGVRLPLSTRMTSL